MSKSKDTALAFQRKKYPHLTDEEFRFMVQQQEGRERLRDKLPTLVQQPDWWFPPRLACEQCSSERTATYKAELIRPHYTPSLSPSLSGVPASNAQWGGFREGRGGSYYYERILSYPAPRTDSGAYRAALPHPSIP